MAGHDVSPDDGGLRSLMESSPDFPVHTSAAAETAFLLALAALLTAPFSLTLGLTVVLGSLGLVMAVTGMAIASRPNVGGRALAPVAMVVSLVALAMVGLRYLGVDTAFGDDLLPRLVDGLESLNSLLPRP